MYSQSCLYIVNVYCVKDTDRLPVRARLHVQARSLQTEARLRQGIGRVLRVSVFGARHLPLSSSTASGLKHPALVLPATATTVTRFPLSGGLLEQPNVFFHLQVLDRKGHVARHVLGLF